MESQIGILASRYIANANPNVVQTIRFVRVQTIQLHFRCKEIFLLRPRFYVNFAYAAAMAECSSRKNSEEEIETVMCLKRTKIIKTEI